MNVATTVIVGLLAFCIVLLGMTDPPRLRASEPVRAQDRTDSHSYGNPEQVRVYQIILDLTVDFERRVIEGAAVLDFSRQPGCPADAPLVVDTKGLSIEEVGVRKMEPMPGSFTHTRFKLDPPDPIKGSRLAIELDPSATQVWIKYRTAPSAGACNGSIRRSRQVRPGRSSLPSPRRSTRDRGFPCKTRPACASLMWR